ncbi:MAG: hypothetical protein NZ529_10910 [Cytophagaceae bacterium]|nr:hypothetical protein [Cytophagaceae bacterium]MDW8457295.1 hypothetical protein [Cytophagaceae bacterium]
MSPSRKKFFVGSAIFLAVLLYLTIDLGMRTTSRWNNENDYFYKYRIEQKNDKLIIVKDSIKRKK